MVKNRFFGGFFWSLPIANRKFFVFFFEKEKMNLKLPSLYPSLWVLSNGKFSVHKRHMRKFAFILFF